MFLSAGQLRNHAVREFEPLCLAQEFSCQRLFLQPLLHRDQDRDLVDKPCIDLRCLMDAVNRKSAAECFCDRPDSLVVHLPKLSVKLCVVQF